MSLQSSNMLERNYTQDDWHWSIILTNKVHKMLDQSTTCRKFPAQCMPELPNKPHGSHSDFS